MEGNSFNEQQPDKSIRCGAYSTCKYIIEYDQKSFQALSRQLLTNYNAKGNLGQKTVLTNQEIASGMYDLVASQALAGYCDPYKMLLQINMYTQKTHKIMCNKDHEQWLKPDLISKLNIPANNFNDFVEFKDPTYFDNLQPKLRVRTAELKMKSTAVYQSWHFVCELANGDVYDPGANFNQPWNAYSREFPSVYKKWVDLIIEPT